MVDLDSFLLHLSREGRKTATVNKYRKELAILLREVQPFTPKNLETYLLKLHNLGRSAVYINMHIINAKVYARWLGLEGFESIRGWKEKPVDKATMSDEEIEAFLTLPKWSINQKSQHYERWTLFFTILAYTGMRPGECAKLTTEDVDFGRGVFILRDTKTNDNRYVPMPPHLLESLTTYVTELDGNLLFPSLRGGNRDGLGRVVDNVDWCYNFQSRIKQLGIKRKKLSVYSLRHSFITRLLEEDVNLFKVQKIVGHNRIETTARYTHLTTKDLHNTLKLDRMAIKKATPQEKIQVIKKYLLAVAQYNEDLDYSIEEKDGEVVFKVKARK